MVARAGTHRFMVVRPSPGPVWPAAAPDVELAVVIELGDRPADDGQKHHLRNVPFASHGDVLDGFDLDLGHVVVADPDPSLRGNDEEPLLTEVEVVLPPVVDLLARHLEPCCFIAGRELLHVDALDLAALLLLQLPRDGSLADVLAAGVVFC